MFGKIIGLTLLRVQKNPEISLNWSHRWKGSGYRCTYLSLPIRRSRDRYGTCYILTSNASARRCQRFCRALRIQILDRSGQTEGDGPPLAKKGANRRRRRRALLSPSVELFGDGMAS